MFPYPWSITGRVVKTYANESDDESKRFTSITISFSSYKGMSDGKPNYESCYVDCIAFGKTAGFMESIEKGKVISVFGEPRVRPYIDDNGNPRASQQLLVAGWSYAPIPFSDGSDSSPPEQSKKPSTNRSSPSRPSTASIPDFGEDEDDDPFSGV